MSILETLTPFLAQALPSLNPGAIADQLMQRFLRVLKSLILIGVLVITCCVSVSFLIDRLLDQLDAGSMTLTPSMILLLSLLVVSTVGILLLLRSISRKERELQKVQHQQRAESALETALAALVMSYVKERETNLATRTDGHP